MSHSSMARRRIASSVLATAVIAVLSCSLVGTTTAASAATVSTPKSSGRAYPGDPKKEAALVTIEEHRIYSLRAITAAARWRGVAAKAPYRVTVEAKEALVLVARTQPYELADLSSLIPDAFVRQPDGSFLLSNDIVVEQGAVLQLSNPDGIRIHLQSSAVGFHSIVATGGGLIVAGSAKAPVTIDSWDPTTGTVDSDTTDGRAYIRVIGGSADFSYTKFDHLGFWSGATGGVSLSGTKSTSSQTALAAVPDPATVGDSTKITNRVKRMQAHTRHQHGQEIIPTTAAAGDIAAVSAGVAATNVGYSFVTARLSHVTSTNNAFGLFVNGSSGITIDNSAFDDNLVDGIILHRYVTNSTVTTTTTRNNGVDGFALTRADTGIMLSHLTSTRNGRDGFSLNGGPLATGPNASGSTVMNYGNNVLSDSSASSNTRNGISVLGGTNVKILRNTASRNQMGIVLSHAATLITISGNTINFSRQHGIALLDGVTAVVISKNSVDHAAGNVYLRNASAIIEHNTIAHGSVHGITLVGKTATTLVSGNTVTGSGSSAIDIARASGAIVKANDVEGWQVTRPFLSMMRSILQPLTVLWIILALIVISTALGGSGRKSRGLRNPYASHIPLSELSRGIVASPASLPALVKLVPTGKRSYTGAAYTFEGPEGGIA